jgi:hypothetical protein
MGKSGYGLVDKTAPLHFRPRQEKITRSFQISWEKYFAPVWNQHITLWKRNLGCEAAEFRHEMWHHGNRRENGDPFNPFSQGEHLLADKVSRNRVPG